MFRAKPKTSPVEKINNKLSSGHQILPFPHVVGQLLAAIKDPNSNSAKFAKIIEADVGLTVRLLRMANSPVYGNSNVVRSVGRATTVIGFEQLKRIALSFAAKSLIVEGSAKQRREMLWNHSLGCATVARELAKSVGSTNSDDAFLAAIFHDVGKIFFYDAIPEEYCDVDDAYSGTELVQRELELFGITHEEVGVKLVTSWQLPEQLMVAVGFHHQPQDAIAHGDLAKLIHVSDALARSSGIGSPPDKTIQILPEVEESLGLEAEFVKRVVTASHQKLEDTIQTA